MYAAYTNVSGLKTGCIAVVGLGDERFELYGYATSPAEAQALLCEAKAEFYAACTVRPGCSAVWHDEQEWAADDAAIDAAADYWMRVAKEQGEQMDKTMAEANATMARIEKEMEVAA